MTMTYQVARDILYDEYEDGYENVVSAEIVGKSRWSVFYSAVYLHTETETYWRLNWTRGATEYQDEGIDDIEFQEVVPVPVTVIKYIAKESTK